MLKCASYDVVFREIPNEVTLALNLSLCSNHCVGCHSPDLQKDIGNLVTQELIENLMIKYGTLITCFCWMGGDNDIKALEQFSLFLKNNYPTLKLAWYSGKKLLPDTFNKAALDYIKLGPFIEKYGPLDKKTTNQKLYKKEKGTWIDITSLFWVEPNDLL